MLRVSLIRLFGAGKGMMMSNSGHTKGYQRLSVVLRKERCEFWFVYFLHVNTSE